MGILLATGLGLLLLAADNLQPNLVNLSYDLPFRGRPGQAPDDLVMVWMDEDSHRELTQPRNDSWDRGLHGQLVERLTKEHARAVVFDIVFSETNATHLQGDERFARAIRENGKVILAAEYAKTPDGSPTMYRAFDALIDAAGYTNIVGMKNGYNHWSRIFDNKFWRRVEPDAMKEVDAPDFPDQSTGIFGTGASYTRSETIEWVPIRDRHKWLDWIEETSKAATPV